MIGCPVWAEPPAAPALRRVDDEQHDEGDGQHDRGDRGRAVVIVFLEFHDNQQRGDLRDIGDIAGDEDHRTVFADAAREGERHAGQ